MEGVPFRVRPAITGTCPGGGTELVLACHFRVAADDPRVEIGLPEVRLGIIPGWGGTQRLPRLVGIAPALDLILTGRTVDARRALTIGLADEIAPPEYLLDAAERLALDAAEGRRRPRRQRRGESPVARPRDLRAAAVVGAGVMGGGIAQALARSGVPVRLKDIDPAALSRGLRAAHDLYGAEVKKGRISRREGEQKFALIQPTLEYTG